MTLIYEEHGKIRKPNRHFNEVLFLRFRKPFTLLRSFAQWLLDSIKLRLRFYTYYIDATDYSVAADQWLSLFVVCQLNERESFVNSSPNPFFPFSRDRLPKRRGFSL